MTGWVQTFGGSAVQPADVSYRAIALTASVELNWPFVDADTDQIVARYNKVTPDAGSRQITMPPANQVSPGMDATFRNDGAFSFEVLSNDGTSIVTIDAGEAWNIIVTDNSDAAGAWDIYQLGAGSSMADAAALAGRGLIALTSKLNQDMPVDVIVASQPVTAASRARVLAVDPSVGSGTLTLDSIASFGAGNFFAFTNLGSGAWTLDPSAGELIDNALTATFNPGEAAEIHCGAGGWYIVGKGAASQFVITQLNLDVSGSSNVTLTTLQAANYIQRYFGTLTGNISVIVPDVVNSYIIVNDTTGAFQLTVKTSGGTGLVIPQGDSVIVRCDGTDVYDADTVAPTPGSLTMPDGSASAPGLSFTLDTNLGFYRIGADEMGIGAGGAGVASFGTNGIDTLDTDLSERGMNVKILAAIFA